MANEKSVWLQADRTEYQYPELPGAFAEADIPDWRESDALRFAYFARCEHYADTFARAVDACEMQVVDPLSGSARRPPLGDVLSRSAVTIQEIGRYAAEQLGMRIRLCETIQTEAWAHRQLDAMKGFADDDLAMLAEKLAGFDGVSGPFRLSKIRLYTKQRQVRQVSGFFTLPEASEILAEARPGSSARDYFERLQAATVNGRRLPREFSSMLPVRPGLSTFAHEWVAKLEDIDDWLKEQGAPGPFPRASEAAEPVPVNKATTPPPLTTPEIADAFDGIDGLTARQWRDKLGDANNHQWVMPARAEKATAPKASTWWPITLAELLVAREASDESLNRAFLTAPKLKPWLPLWQEKRRERNAFGQ